MSIKETIINQIIEVEGGYVNDPFDSGGETMHGITVSVARKNGYTGSMKRMPRNIAFNIYAKKYWDANNLSVIAALSELIAEEVADTGVNIGVRRAGRFLQRSLNVLNRSEKDYPDIVVDGKVGKNTAKTLAKFIELRKETGIIVLMRMLNSLQGAKYIQLAERREKDERFILGWFRHRVV